MTNKNNFFALISLLILSNTSFAQQNRFNAGLIAGLNFSALTGDEITDYYGLNVGIIGTAKLDNHKQLGIEFLYSQNGEYLLPEFYPNINYKNIKLTYLEIPVHLDWLINVFHDHTSPDWNLNIGVAYALLLNHKTIDTNSNDISDEIIFNDKSSWLLQAGSTYHFSKNLGLNLRATLPIQTAGLGLSLAARMIYLI